MSQSCPLSFQTIDSNVSRINSLIVAALLITYLVSFNVVIVYFLLFEFMMKFFFKKDVGIIMKFSKFIKNALGLEDKFTDIGAKRLAGYFGIFFLLLLVAGNSLNLYLFSMAVGVLFLSCSLLDVLFNYCVGCKIYFIIKKTNPSFMS